MPHADETAGRDDYQTPNAKSVYEVTKDALPLHCPTPETSLWNSHPRVYIPLQETGEYRCPYCGAVYRLVAE